MPTTWPHCSRVLNGLGYVRVALHVGYIWVPLCTALEDIEHTAMAESPGRYRRSITDEWDIDRSITAAVAVVAASINISHFVDSCTQNPQ